MKILFLLFVAILLTYGTMESDAKRLLLGEVGRSLSDGNLGGRKANIGGDDKLGVVGNKESENIGKSSSEEQKPNEDDKNESFGNFGHGKSGSSDPGSHRFFPCATRDHPCNFN